MCMPGLKIRAAKSSKGFWGFNELFILYLSPCQMKWILLLHGKLFYFIFRVSRLFLIGVPLKDEMIIVTDFSFFHR